MRLRIKTAIGLGTAVVLGAGLSIAASAAQPVEGRTIASLASGEWTLRFRNGGAPRKLCVKPGRELVKLRHQGARCRTFVVNDEGGTATVNYSCEGHGSGSTTIKRETREIVQIESQGIEDGAPFHFSAEARLTGTCR